MESRLAQSQAVEAPAATGVTEADPHPQAAPLLPALQTYARRLRVPVTLHIPAAHFRPPQPPTALHVHCYAVPRRPVLFGLWPRVPRVRVPFAFGYPLPAPTTFGFVPSPAFGRSRVLADDEGRAMVEVMGANLYILVDLLPQGDLAPILLRRCLDVGLVAVPALPRLCPLEAEARASALATLARGTAEAEAAWRGRQREESGRRFHEECATRLADEARRLAEETRALERSLEDLGRRITADTRALAERRRRLQALRARPQELPATLREFERIQQLPEVRHLEVQDGVITFITHPLEAECVSQRFRLGAFRVEIHFEGEVRITNLTEARGLYDHPHVRYGRPCLGNAREGVAKLIGEFEFAAAAQVLIDFLQTVNPQDWRIPIFYWPRADA